MNAHHGEAAALIGGGDRALACGLVTPVSAEVHLEGNLSALRVTASGDALSDVLTAFGAQWPVRYRSSVPLNVDDRGSLFGVVVPGGCPPARRLQLRDQAGWRADRNSSCSARAAKPCRAAGSPVKGALSRWHDGHRARTVSRTRAVTSRSSPA